MVTLLLVILLSGMSCFSMEEKAVLLQKITPTELIHYKGKDVLCEKKEGEFFWVRLGEQVGHTGYWQVYLDGQKGICLPQDAFYMPSNKLAQ